MVRNTLHLETIADISVDYHADKLAQKLYQKLVKEKEIHLIVKFSAIGLKNTDLIGQSDPYLEVWTLKPQLLRKTEWLRNNLNPSWKVFSITQRTFAPDWKFQNLVFKVFDRDLIGKNDLIGQAECSSKTLLCAALQKKSLVWRLYELSVTENSAKGNPAQELTGRLKLDFAFANKDLGKIDQIKHLSDESVLYRSIEDRESIRSSVGAIDIDSISIGSNKIEEDDKLAKLDQLSALNFPQTRGPTGTTRSGSVAVTTVQKQTKSLVGGRRGSEMPTLEDELGASTSSTESDEIKLEEKPVVDKASEKPNNGDQEELEPERVVVPNERKTSKSVRMSVELIKKISVTTVEYTETRSEQNDEQKDLPGFEKDKEELMIRLSQVGSIAEESGDENEQADENVQSESAPGLRLEPVDGDDRRRKISISPSRSADVSPSRSANHDIIVKEEGECETSGFEDGSINRDSNSSHQLAIATEESSDQNAAAKVQQETDSNQFSPGGLSSNEDCQAQVSPTNSSNENEAGSINPNDSISDEKLRDQNHSESRKDSNKPEDAKEQENVEVKLNRDETVEVEDEVEIVEKAETQIESTPNFSFLSDLENKAKEDEEAINGSKDPEVISAAESRGYGETGPIVENTVDSNENDQASPEPKLEISIEATGRRFEASLGLEESVSIVHRAESVEEINESVRFASKMRYASDVDENDERESDEKSDEDISDDQEEKDLDRFDKNDLSRDDINAHQEFSTDRGNLDQPSPQGTTYDSHEAELIAVKELTEKMDASFADFPPPISSSLHQPSSDKGENNRSDELESREVEDNLQLDGEASEKSADVLGKSNENNECVESDHSNENEAATSNQDNEKRETPTMAEKDSIADEANYFEQDFGSQTSKSTNSSNEDSENCASIKFEPSSPSSSIAPEVGSVAGRDTPLIQSADFENSCSHDDTGYQSRKKLSFDISLEDTEVSEDEVPSKHQEEVHFAPSGFDNEETSSLNHHDANLHDSPTIVDSINAITDNETSAIPQGKPEKPVVNDERNALPSTAEVDDEVDSAYVKQENTVEKNLSVHNFFDEVDRGYAEIDALKDNGKKSGPNEEPKPDQNREDSDEDEIGEDCIDAQDALREESRLFPTFSDLDPEPEKVVHERTDALWTGKELTEKPTDGDVFLSNPEPNAHYEELSSELERSIESDIEKKSAQSEDLVHEKQTEEPQTANDQDDSKNQSVDLLNSSLDEIFLDSKNQKRGSDDVTKISVSINVDVSRSRPSSPQDPTPYVQKASLSSSMVTEVSSPPGKLEPFSRYTANFSFNNDVFDDSPLSEPVLEHKILLENGSKLNYASPKLGEFKSESNGSRNRKRDKSSVTFAEGSKDDDDSNTRTPTYWIVIMACIATFGFTTLVLSRLRSSQS